MNNNRNLGYVYPIFSFKSWGLPLVQPFPWTQGMHITARLRSSAMEHNLASTTYRKPLCASLKMYGGRQGRSSTSLFFLFILVSAAVCLCLLCPLCLRSLIADSTNGMCSMSFYVYAMWLLRHKGHIMRHNYTAAEAKTNRKNNDGSSYLVFRHTSRAICYTICFYVFPNIT